MRVKFKDAESLVLVGGWDGAQHWVAREEQVWFGNKRYKVVRVEHVNEAYVVCFVRGL